MNWLGYALLAAVLQSAATILQKETLSKGSSMRFSFILMVLKAALFLPLIRSFNLSALHGWAPYAVLGSGILGSFAFVLTAKSLKHMEISTISPLFLLSPALAAITSYLFLHETLNLLQSGGIGLLLVGAYVLQTSRGGSIWEPFIRLRTSKYVQYILLALLVYGFSGMLDRASVSQFGINPDGYLEAVFLLQALFSTLIYAFSLRGWHEVATEKLPVLPVLGVALLTAAYQYAQIHAMVFAVAGLVLAVKRASSVVTGIIGGEIFHEHDLLRKGFAGGIMMAGVVVLVWH